MVKWFKRCVAQMPDKRTLIDSSRDIYVVREIDPELEVLPLHDRFQAISLKQENSSMAGYYHYKPKTGQDEWIPLLPGYSVFFQMAKRVWKCSIINENYRLKFQWQAYETNSD